MSVSTTEHFAGERDAYVGEPVVDEAAAGAGIGRALMARAERWALDAGLRGITLHTGAANTAARAFYEALGYVEEDVKLTRVLGG